MITVASLLAGCGLGAALGYYDARPWAFGVVSDGMKQPEAEPADEPAGGGPVVEIDEPTFNFDKMQRGAKMRHEFDIRNAGTQTLTVTFVSHTCKCTKVELGGQDVTEGDKISIPPGETGVAALEWEAKIPPGPFRHGGSFSTNDPKQSRLELMVEGDVVESTTLLPAQLVFDPIPLAGTGEAELLVVASMEPEVVIEGYEFDKPELAERMTVTVEQVAEADLPTPTSSAAARVRAEYRPAGVIGQFGGTLRLTTNLKEAPELAVEVYGLVRGDLSVYGTGWIAHQGLLRMPPVKQAEGGSVDLKINVRGDQAANAELSVASVDPPQLSATLGEPKRLREELTQYPLTISIAPGVRPMVRMGEEHGGEGQIVLKSSDPDAPELRMRVQFRVVP